MIREDLDALLAMPVSIRRDAEKILFALEDMPDGYNATTSDLARDVLGYPQGTDNAGLFDLDLAIRLLAESHGLKIDGDHHGNIPEGLPFNLDYYVWHKANAAANGKFPTGANPEERDYRYVHDDIVADAIAEILTKALPAYAVPTELRFDARDVCACDAEILTVGCDFSIGVFDFEMSMQFFTGGGTMIYPGCPIPEPRVTSAEISCEGSDDEGRSLAYEWTYDKPEWRAAANAPQWQRIDEFKKKWQDIWRDDVE